MTLRAEETSNASAGAASALPPAELPSAEPPTERRNPRTTGLDAMPTLELLQALNDEDARVPGAVAAVLPELARAVDLAVERVRGGGRVHYVGAGTSGRLAVLDAAELMPTFDAPPGLVVPHHAGGTEALVRAVEEVEDSPEAGRAAVADVTAADVVLGLTASGRTPFVAGALRAARAAGAATVLVTSDPRSPLAPLADVLLAPDTGPEALTGSTRLKAGSAQKLVLNGFSTALMVRLGRTWSNLMVDLVATNAKLRRRTLRILVEATGEPEDTCRTALSRCGGELKTALLLLLTDCPPPACRDALAAAGGSVTAARALLDPTTPLARPAPRRP